MHEWYCERSNSRQSNVLCSQRTRSAPNQSRCQSSNGVKSYVALHAVEGAHDELFGVVAIKQTLGKLRSTSGDKTVESVT